MQVTSLLSDHDHEHGPGCGHDHSHSNVGLGWMLFGLVFVINAFIVDWVFAASHVVAGRRKRPGTVLTLNSGTSHCLRPISASILQPGIWSFGFAA